MFKVPSLAKYADRKKAAEDKQWLETTAQSIRRTSAIRDELAEEAKKSYAGTGPNPIGRHTIKLGSNIASRIEANPKKSPLQKTQYQILVEAMLNTCMMTGWKQEDAKLLREAYSSLADLDGAILLTRPQKRGDKHYEQWWRDAINKMPPKKFERLTNVLSDLPGAFHSALGSHHSYPLTKSASVLLAQTSRAKEPPFYKKALVGVLKVIKYALTASQVTDRSDFLGQQAVEDYEVGR
jgi:hypothetical protein